MAKTFFIAKLNDQTFTRSTASRAYTHMAVGRRCYDRAMDQATGGQARKSDERNFRYYEALSQGFHHDRQDRRITSQDYYGQWKASYPTQEKIDAQIEADRVEGLEKMEGFTNGADYAAAKMAARVAKLEEMKAAGAFEVYHDLGWASRLDLAQKNAASHRGYYAETRVLEAMEVTPAAYKACLAHQKAGR